MKKFLNEADFLINNMLNIYQVGTISQLSHIINVAQQTISNWKARNSINAIKKLCLQLEIYDEVFGNLEESKNNIINLQGSNISGSGVNNGNTIIHNSSKPSSIPDFIIEDLEILFKRAKDNKDSLIDAMDNFISAQKKLYR